MTRYQEMILDLARGLYLEKHDDVRPVVRITYDHGSMNLNIFDLFPVSAGDVKRIFSALDRVPDYNDAATAAEQIRAFCAEMAAIFQDVKKTHGSSAAAYCDSMIKKYAGNVETFAARYDLEKIDVEKAPRMKSADVFALEQNDDGSARVVRYDGKQFEKGGRTWTVYGKKSGRRTHYNLLDPRSGCRVALLDRAADAPGVLTPEKLNELENVFKTENYAFMVKRFEDAFSASDWSYLRAETPADVPAPAAVDNVAETIENAAERPQNVATDNTPETEPRKNKIPRDARKIEAILNGRHMIIIKDPVDGWTGTDDAGKRWHVFPSHLRNGELCTICAIYTAEDLARPETAAAPAAVETTPAESPALNYDPDRVDIDELLRRFSSRYSWLYNMNGAEFNLEAFRDAVRIFDNELSEADKIVLNRFCLARFDYVSSDREAAAFIMALTDVLNAAETAPAVSPAKTAAAAAETPHAAPEDVTTGTETGARDNVPVTPGDVTRTPGDGATMPGINDVRTCAPETITEPTAAADARHKTPGRLARRRRTLRAILRRHDRRTAARYTTTPYGAAWPAGPRTTRADRYKLARHTGAPYGPERCGAAHYGPRDGMTCGADLTPWEATKGPPRTTCGA